MDNITIITYTNSKYSSIWEICFSQMKELFGENIKNIVLSDKFPINIDKNKICITYDDDNQILSEHIMKALENVNTEFILWLQEDFIGYDYLDKEKFIQCINVLKDTSYDFCVIRNENLKKIWPENKIQKTPWGYTSLNSENIVVNKIFYEINNDNPMLYTHQPNIWKTTSFKKVHEHMISIKDNYKDNVVLNSKNKRKSLLINKEGFINNQCKNNNLIKGVCHFDNNAPYYCKNNKTYQSTILPFLNLIIRGKINLKDHNDEILKLFKKYKYDYKNYFQNNI